MLRNKPSQTGKNETGARQRKGQSGGVYSNREDGEKVGKIRRQQESRLLSALALLAILCFTFLVAIVKLRHNTQTSPRSSSHSHSASLSQLRSRKTSDIDGSIEVQPPSHQHDNLLLPPHSIYKLLVPDANGNPTSLEKFAGMVTLIVNVACL